MNNVKPTLIQRLVSAGIEAVFDFLVSVALKQVFN